MPCRVRLSVHLSLIFIYSFIGGQSTGATSREGWSVPLPPALQASIRRLASAGSTPGPVENAPPFKRLPNGYGKLGLSDKQKEAIYKIRGGYKARIEQIQRELETLKQAEADACRAILTESQRNLMDRSKPRGSSPDAAALP